MGARKQGYQWFSLGMAPLAGLESRPLAPAWNKLGNVIFRSGEHIYNFEGLRHYKQKFEPEWAPRYLASKGGIQLPAVLMDTTALVSGGVEGFWAADSNRDACGVAQYPPRVGGGRAAEAAEESADRKP